MTNYETLYPGTTYLLEPSYHSTGYRIPMGALGGTTSIQTSNQLNEVNKLLNQGMKVTEVSVINPEVFEMIPKENFKEINRVNKLVGAESTLHAPTIDPAGFTQEGWSEENQRAVQRQFENWVQRGHDLNPDGNMPVTIHASVIPGSEIMPAIKELMTPEEKEKGVKEFYSKIIAIDQESGRPINLEREKKYYPGREGEIRTPEQELELANESYWDQQLAQLVFYKERADELAKNNFPLINNADKRYFTSEQKAAEQRVSNAMAYYKNASMSLNSLYNHAYKFADDKTRKLLRNAADNYQEKYNEYVDAARKGKMDPESLSGALQNLMESMQVITDSNSAERGIWNNTKVGSWKIPEKYKQVEEFAKEKTSETLSNVALKAYDKFGEKSPIISIENPPYGQAMSSGKELKSLIETTRDKFAEKLMREHNLSRKEAENAAEKLIGATWDTSHISMIRKQGFGPEKITKETKEIAPFVKHVHFNDNFGTTHTDLPPGMGSVPFKDVLEVLEKGKGKTRKIFEGGQFVQNFQTSPFPYVLESTTGGFYEGSPYFGQVYGLQAPYFSERGAINPSIHHSLYGSRFQTLPLELGGEVGGSQSRFAGTPNA